MRWLPLVVVLAGCPLPEDRFVLAGLVEPDPHDAPVTVRLLRGADPTGARCWPMTELATTTSDEAGAYRFELVRQQVFSGNTASLSQLEQVNNQLAGADEAGHWFRVEREHALGTIALVFRFPPFDLMLPSLGSSFSVTDASDIQRDQTYELVSHGLVAWRGATQPTTFDQQSRVFEVSRWLFPQTQQSNTFGVQVEVQMENRIEREIRAVDVVENPWRAAACDVVPEGEVCPLTDGRPDIFELPAGTRQIELHAADTRPVFRLSFRGLRVDGEPAQVRVEGANELTAWFPFTNSRAIHDAVIEGRSHCREPGAFFTVQGPTTWSVRYLRFWFEDAEGRRLVIRALGEVSSP